MYTWRKFQREGVRYPRARRREGQGGDREARRRGGRSRKRRRGFGGRSSGRRREGRLVGREYYRYCPEPSTLGLCGGESAVPGHCTVGEEEEQGGGEEGRRAEVREEGSRRIGKRTGAT